MLPLPAHAHVGQRQAARNVGDDEPQHRRSAGRRSDRGEMRSFCEGMAIWRNLVGNTFAYRATDQKRLIKVPDPVGPENDAHVIEMAKEAAIVVFAYGQPCHATLRPRGLALARLLMKEAGVTPHTLRLAKNGTPWHPLYLPETLKPFIWKL